MDFECASILNRKIADNCITKIKDKLNSLTVFEAKNNGKLAKLSLYKNTKNIFFKTLSNSLPSPEFALENGDENAIQKLETDLLNFDTLIVSLFVPKAKPLNNFDIEDSVLSFLERLYTTKKCVLYVFGNPYVLQVIPNLEATLGIIQVYQDFAEFQDNAAHQLLENTQCKGSLPVIIRGIND
jgi:hypothetical protein